MTIELRSFTAESVEATDDGHVFGLAIPYSRVTTIGNMDHGGFREQIAPGACNKSLREADIVALNNHNSSEPLGRTSAGNLTLKSTTRGIEPDLQPIDTTYGTNLIKNVKAGIVKGWSFGFEVIKDEWRTAEGEIADEYTGTDRTIREMKLVEVSPVTFPAYESTSIGLRSSILEQREARLTDSAAVDEKTRQGRPAGRTDGTTGERAAKATYADLDTCAECGATSQYGGFCTNCGEPMGAPLATKSYCGSCGSKMAGKRSHKCAPEKRAGSAPGDGSKPYGNVTYADPGYQKDGQKRYPLDTKKRAMAAWSYINQADNASLYNSEQLASIKAKIKSALKSFGVNVSDDEAKAAELADEWRAAREAKHERKTAKRAASEERADKSIACPACGVKLVIVTPKVGGSNKAHQLPVPKPADPNVYGANHGVGETTSTMIVQNSADPVDETREKTSNLTSGTKKRIPQIDAILDQALKLFGNADPKSLPDDVKTAIALVSSAATHASHIADHEGLDPTDAISDNDKRSVNESKPADATSEDLPDDAALILMRMHMISREVAQGK